MYPNISQSEFLRFQRFMREEVGITLGDNKRSLVVGRLGRRLKLYNLDNFGDYFSLVESNNHPEERQVMVDLLTTHETFFFREDAHFKFLSDLAKSSTQSGGSLRVWSAACSSGEEPYSIAMTLADSVSDHKWSLMASDISMSSLESARKGLYTQQQVQKVPKEYLSKYFLKGVRSQEGKYLIDKSIRNKIEFTQVNLNNQLTDIGMFDVIFLRNVLIYFDLDNKKNVVNRVVDRLKTGGYLIVGHSETLSGVSSKISYVKPSLYRKRPHHVGSDQDNI